MTVQHDEVGDVDVRELVTDNGWSWGTTYDPLAGEYTAFVRTNGHIHTAIAPDSEAALSAAYLSAVSLRLATPPSVLRRLASLFRRPRTRRRLP